MRSPTGWLAFVALTVVAVLAFLSSSRYSHLEDVAAGLLGERWYRVELHGDAVGAFVSRATRTDEGHRFETDLRFRLGGEPEVHIADELVFGPPPDHRLQYAAHAFTSADTSLRTSVRRNGERLEAILGGKPVTLDWDYRMADYMMLEAWLARDRGSSARIMTRSLDLARLRVDRQVWQVMEQTDAGYRLRQAATFGETEIELDANFAPIRFDLAGVFSIERVSGIAQASNWRETPAGVPPRYAVPLDTPLPMPREVTGLTLRVRVPEDADAAVWPALAPGGDGNWLLVTGDDALRGIPPEETSALTRPTASLPANDPEIGRLAARAVRGTESPGEQVDALVHFVHGHLDYEEREDVQPVSETVATRRGDCTEYADLLTTLARARGIPARTVTGLAYDVDAEMFALHSWNEVGVDGVWRGVDPTWGQTRLDATHIPLPEENGLAVLGLLPRLAFELVATEYRVPRSSSMPGARPAPTKQ